jgi:hypothetical protein
MKLRLLPWRRRVEPAGDEPARAEPAPEAPPEPVLPPAETEADEPTPPVGARSRQPASAFERPYAAGGEAAPALPAEPPARVSLTLEEAKQAIRVAGGDVIQIGFLASAYGRHREEEPESAETAAARRRLCELVAQRLRDRKLLAPEGRFELLEGPPARERTA